MFCFVVLQVTHVLKGTHVPRLGRAHGQCCRMLGSCGGKPESRPRPVIATLKFLEGSQTVFSKRRFPDSWPWPGTEELPTKGGENAWKRICFEAICSTSALQDPDPPLWKSPFGKHRLCLIEVPLQKVAGIEMQCNFDMTKCSRPNLSDESKALVLLRFWSFC